MFSNASVTIPSVIQVHLFMRLLQTICIVASFRPLTRRDAILTILLIQYIFGGQVLFPLMA
jgi:hypothetical protein